MGPQVGVWFFLFVSIWLCFLFVFFREWGLLPQPVMAPELILLQRRNRQNNALVIPKIICANYTGNKQHYKPTTQRNCLSYLWLGTSDLLDVLVLCIVIGWTFQVEFLASPRELKGDLIMACVCTEFNHISVLSLIIHGTKSLFSSPSVKPVTMHDLSSRCRTWMSNFSSELSHPSPSTKKGIRVPSSIKQTPKCPE